jgi:ADP-heptose:LPS heptosyltransferase
VRSLAGRLDLPGLVGVLAEAAVVLANDSGPRHLAQAVGAKTVGIFVFGNTINAMPFGRGRHRIRLGRITRCPICGRDATQVGWTAERCEHDPSYVADVPVDDVLEDVLALLAG